ncbi:RNA pseudouridine synthase [Campylobacter insulaenigrae]|uniref:pseudouridine synthase family protein n=1 Tax=Campylobacter insulaenigrae TaxID=260714 RepID=UPI002152707E|nr:RNA pseudouridine synthase [Campylobacter insulaenigrae]MCR6573332.1 RNA pseudouridine synthase [Campylobacter insulaenigrae]MCR6574797.1 RNA pseudouridine synthase [Campylobacter insulaenigrae]MCR6579419.1 RNA pseudouridine synthase [Campylobacter insulaenigrae]MCR6585774.1 RNA pseudouridine synthase [Campylobacter insulaenigrae]
MQDKAYKLLAIQEKISNNQAKDLIDSGCVFAMGKKIVIARALMNSKTKFVIQKIKKAKILYEDDNIIALDKPFGQISENLEIKFKAKLINRLDKETSGVLLLSKNENFRLKCIEEYKKQNVYKSYLAIVDGIIAEEVEIHEKISTTKTNNGAFSKIDKFGLESYTHVIPLMVNAKKTLIKAIIKTGRTHQIRVHLKHIKNGIIGDEKYAKISAARMFLHCYETNIFDYNFKALLDDSFNVYGFEIKNLNF